MTAKRIGLVVNNPMRDLPGLTLLSKVLAENEAHVFLIPFNLLRTEGMLLAPDFLLVNYLRKTNEKHVKAFLECGIQVGILDAEGGVMPDFTTFQSKLTADSELRKKMAVFCSWGPHLAKHMIQQGWFAASQVAVTGCPRFDFYNDPWRQTALKVSRHIEQFPTPLILINTRFSLANPEFMSREQQKEVFVKKFGKEPGLVDHWQDIQLCAMREMAALANRLARSFPQATFILRPHPFENPAPYLKLIDPLPNLHLVRQGTIEGWILRSSAVIHRCCSTAIEAGMAGIPAFSPRWIEMPEEISSTEDVSIPCSNMEEMVECISKVLSSQFIRNPLINNAFKKVVGDWFFKCDGLSHERVATEILKVCRQKHSNVDSRMCRKKYLSKIGHTPGTQLIDQFYNWAEWPVSHVRQGVRSSTGDQDSWQESSKCFTPIEVQELLDSLGTGNKENSLLARKARVGVWPGWPLNSVCVKAKSAIQAMRLGSDD